jgi:hypothetical protein
MPHNPASIARCLYGERTAEGKTAPLRFLSILPQTVWHPPFPSVKATFRECLEWIQFDSPEANFWPALLWTFIPVRNFGAARDSQSILGN